jgi:hypothetical protein
MIVTSVGGVPARPWPAKPQTEAPVIDLNTIRAILYLGLKGDATASARRGEAGGGLGRSARPGVDTYA